MRQLSDEPESPGLGGSVSQQIVLQSRVGPIEQDESNPVAAHPLREGFGPPRGGRRELVADSLSDQVIDVRMQRGVGLSGRGVVLQPQGKALTVNIGPLDRIAAEWRLVLLRDSLH